MPKGIKKLMITSIALSQLALPGLSHAAARAFYDNFDNGKANGWDYMECPVVQKAADGVVGPHSGSYMLQCNWNGAVAWNHEDSMQNGELNYWSYDNEFFMRFWIRYDRDVDHNDGGKLFRLGFGGPEEVCWRCQMSMGDNATFYMAWTGIDTFWGGKNPKAFCGDHSKWHKVEIYVKNDTNGHNGIARTWMDGNIMKEWVNIKTHTPGAHRYPFNLMSNWSSNSGWEHDANNHVYWDDIEIYSDVGTGACGSMAEATIHVGSDCSQQTKPQNLRATQ